MASAVGQTIRSLRISRNETLSDVSRATGLSIAMLSRIERGQRSPSPAAVIALANHFGLPPRDLLGEALAERICTRYGTEPASWAAILLVQTVRPEEQGSEPAPARPAASTLERLVSDLSRSARWGDREEAIAACVALRRLADAPLGALRDVCEHHPDPAVRSAAAALLTRGPQS